MLKSIKTILITVVVIALSLLTYFLFAFLKIFVIGISVLCVGYVAVQAYRWIKNR